MFRLFPPRDEQLVQRALRGRRDAFELLVHRHLPSVRAVAYARTGNFADAEDAAQETFLRALQGLDGLREASRFGAWLLGIARNVSNQLRTARAKEFAAINAAPVELAQQPDIERNELRAIVRKRLEELDEPHREIILLHYFAGNKIKDVAALLEISQEAARKRLQRARETLGALLLDDLQADAGQAAPFRRDGSRIVYALTALPFPWGSATPAAATTTSATLAGVLMSTKTIVTATAAALIVLGSVTAFVLRPQAKTAPLATHAGIDVSIPGKGGANMKAPQESASATSLADSQTPKAGGATLRGFVFDPHDKPVEGARVQYADYEEGQKTKGKSFTKHDTITGSDGAFRFDGLAPSKMAHIHAEKEGMVTPTTSSRGNTIIEANAYTLPKGGLSNVVVRLWPAGSIRGYVTNSAGKTLAGEDVTSRLTDYVVPIIATKEDGLVNSLLSSMSKRPTFSPTVSTKTDPQGRFVLTGLLPGTHTLAIAPEEQMHDIKDAEVKLKEGETLDGVHLVLTGGVLSISGRVLDDHGAPIERAFIEAVGGTRTFTGADGSYRLARLAEGAYILSAGSDHYETGGRQGVVAGSQNVDIVLAAKAAGITGRVIAAESGKPVSDFEILVRAGRDGLLPPNAYSMFTRQHNAQGQFTLPTAPSGTATIVVRATGFAMAFQRVETASAKVTDGIIVKMVRGVAVEGRTVTATGDPAPGTYIFLGDASGPLPPAPQLKEVFSKVAVAQSDSKGRFRVDALAPGPQFLSAYSTTDGRGSTDFVVSEKPAPEVTMVLYKGGSITGRVSLAGKPVEKAVVMATLPGGFGVPLAEAATASDGSYTLTGVRPGDVSVFADVATAGTSEKRRQLKNLVVSEGNAVEMLFDFGAAEASIEGQVTALGNPRSGSLQLQIESGESTSEKRFAQIGDDGHYKVDHLPAGSGTIRVNIFTAKNNDQSKTISFETDGRNAQRRDIEFTGKAVAAGHVEGIGPNENGTVIALEGEQNITNYSLATLESWNVLGRGSAIPGDDGAYRIEGLEPGAYTLVALASPSRSAQGIRESILKTRFTTAVVRVSESAETTTDLVIP